MAQRRWRYEDADFPAAAAPPRKLVKTARGAGLEEMKAAQEWLRPKKAAVFPKVVPLETPYTRDSYYVRECYPEYYALVKTLLSDGGFSGVTVTGTPGIGKSVFMGYFFQRYSKQFPDATITMLSYNFRSVLTKVVTTWRGQTVKEARRSMEGVIETVYASTDAAHKAALANPNDQSIWLIDGPPEMIPQDVNWVAFTCSNKDWTAQTRKNDTCCEVFMPVWTLEELCDAIAELNRVELLCAIDAKLLRVLGVAERGSESSGGVCDDNNSIYNGDDSDPDIDDTEVKDGEMDAESNEPNPTLRAILDEFVSRPAVIEFRFKIFGGIPRECFQCDDENFIRAVEELEQAARKLTPDQALDAIRYKSAHAELHPLLHYVPVTKGFPYPYRRATIQVASVAIERLLDARAQEGISIVQKPYGRIAHYVPDMEALQGDTFEA